MIDPAIIYRIAAQAGADPRTVRRAIRDGVTTVKGDRLRVALTSALAAHYPAALATQPEPRRAAS